MLACSGETQREGNLENWASQMNKNLWRDAYNGMLNKPSTNSRMEERGVSTVLKCNTTEIGLLEEKRKEKKNWSYKLSPTESQPWFFNFLKKICNFGSVWHSVIHNVFFAIIIYSCVYASSISLKGCCCQLIHHLSKLIYTISAIKRIVNIDHNLPCFAFKSW